MLKILHRVTEEGPYRTHQFLVKRMRFSSEELKQAEFVETNGKLVDTVSYKRNKTSLQKRFPYYEFIFDKNENSLQHLQAYPYPLIKSEQKSLPRFAQKGKGLGTIFDRKVCEYLLGIFPPETPIRRGTNVSEAREDHLERAGLYDRANPYKTFTLQQHYDGWLALEKKNEEKNKKT